MSDLQEGEKEEKKTQAVRKYSYPPLNRPIIMICNNGFAKNLIPLRNIVIKLQVNHCSSERLTERIGEILRAENKLDVSLPAIK